MRVFGLKAAQVFFDNFNIVFEFQNQESQESGTFGQKRPKVCRIFHHNAFYAHLRVFGLKAAQEFFFDNFNLVFEFQNQKSHESDTFGQKRPKVCRIFHHNAF